ncbi:MAG: LEA type 2 family protein [Cyclobacteriaceae bacterium]
MNKRSWSIVWLVFSVSLFSCKTPISPEFKEIKDLKVQLAGFTSANIKGEALFYNPNKTSINIRDIIMDVAVDGNKITTVEQEFNVVAKGMQDFSLPIDIKIPLKDLQVNSITSALSMMSGDMKTLHFKGKIKVKVYGLNFSVPVDHYEEVTLKL